MRLLAVVALGLLASGGSSAQDGRAASGLIEARQAEVARLGVLYGLDLKVGDWTHQEVAVCPAFTHHVFARYDLKDGAGGMASFMAIYSLDVGAAKSLAKPWDGGIVLLPLFGIHGGDRSLAIERRETMSVFNRVWGDELARSGGVVFEGLTWPGLAGCYARLANEQPVRNRDFAVDSTDVIPRSPSINMRGEQVGGVLITFVGTDRVSRVARFDFDTKGMVTRVKVNVSPRAE